MKIKPNQNRYNVYYDHPGENNLRLIMTNFTKQEIIKKGVWDHPDFRIELIKDEDTPQCSAVFGV